MISRADRIGLALLVGSLGALVTVLLVGALLQHSGGGIDPRTGCLVGRVPAAETVVLIDLTDPLPDLQQREVRGFLSEFAVDSLKPYERLTLWTLSGAREGALRRRFSRCCPARTADPLVGNSDLAAALSESLFATPLRRTLDSLPARESAATSPLLEAVRQVCSQPEFEERGVPRRFVLVSNLEQNSRLLCLYESAPDFTAFSHTSDYGTVQVELGGVDVEVLYVPHGRAAVDLGTTLTDFWNSHFLACGAGRVRMRRL